VPASSRKYELSISRILQRMGQQEGGDAAEAAGAEAAAGEAEGGVSRRLSLRPAKRAKQERRKTTLRTPPVEVGPRRQAGRPRLCAHAPA
jgi:hypothetical protein